MHKIFIKALAWNSSTAFIYKIALLLHQILLYSVVSHILYGLQSTLFAVIYTSIALTNFGFEDTLLPFFSTFTQSKQQFRQVWFHYIGYVITVACIALFLYTILAYGTGEFLHNMRIYCNKNIILMTASIFFIESLKKSLVAMMQLAFLNKSIAYAEIIMLSAYMICLWATYLIQGELSLTNIFMPMLFVSSIELLYLLYNFITFYGTLPSLNAVSVKKIPLSLICKQRAYNYINQIAKIVYSPNSMTIFFAYLLGFQQAATIKFFTNIITLCYTCISKSIGVTTGATLSAMHHMPLQALQSFFKDVTKRYLQFLTIVSSVFLVIVGYSYYFSIITPLMALHILLFFTVTFLEHFSVTYEQLFITQQAAQFLTKINSISLILISISYYTYKIYSINYLIIIAVSIIVKAISLKAMIFFAHRRWGV